MANSLVLLLLLADVATAQFSGTFAPTGNMVTSRARHSATLLPNGKVLIAGGVRSTSFSSAEVILASAELYDPGTGTFGPTGDMVTARTLHTATLLADGKVLITGGYGSVGVVASAELFDPAVGTFRATGDMVTPRGWHTAILLPNGKVMILGGYGTSGYPNVAPAEIYDPATGMFTAGPSYVSSGGCDFCAPSTLLADGRVLFPGQYPAQLYDPVSDSFSLTGRTISDPSTAILLANGRVLFAGGEPVGRSSSAELYDPDTGTFASTGSMAWRRVWHTVSLLPNGMVLTTGGETDSCTATFCIFAGSISSAELYDPSTGTFSATGDMATPREIHTATLLNDGRVLVAGGVSYGGIGIFWGSLASAELYSPPVLAPAPALFSLSGNGHGQGAIQHAGTNRIASASDPAAAGEYLSIYLTGLVEGSVIPPQVAIGGSTVEITFFGSVPGYPGLNVVNIRMPSGIAPGLAVPVRLTYLNRPSNEVTIGVQ